MKKLVLFSFGFIATALSVSAQKESFIANPITLGATVDGWTEVSNGLKFRIWKHGAGKPPQVGDFVLLHTRARVGDSILFSSRLMNNNEPFELQIRPAQLPKFDLMEGFQLLTAGDSATFRLSLDTMLNLGAPQLPWMKKGAGMWFDQDVVMVKQTKQADAFKEKAAKGKAHMEADEKELKAYFAKNNIKAIQHPSGLFFKITKNGTGDTARDGKKVTLNYTGKTLAGKTFDSNTDTAFHHVEPFSFELGKGQVIPGWEIGVGLLKKGSKATFYIPSPLAYGERSPGPEIPKNAILVFDVELMNIEEPAKEANSPDDGQNH